ncbi:TPA: hypothetical protein I7152_09910 [Vibrio vulnificus]|nr:hypothetical protein [Vibrio vulnificus]
MHIVVNQSNTPSSFAWYQVIDFIDFIELWFFRILFKKKMGKYSFLPSITFCISKLANYPNKNSILSVFWGKGELALVALTRISTQAFQEKSL